MEDCVFCKIIRGDIPAQFVYESDHVVAFPDISPQAPKHFLVIPKAHVENILQLGEESEKILGEVQKAIARLALEHGLDEKGFRVVNNCGEEGGQTVPHLHFHLLGGRPMLWPPG